MDGMIPYRDAEAPRNGTTSFTAPGGAGSTPGWALAQLFSTLFADPKKKPTDSRPSDGMIPFKDATAAREGDAIPMANAERVDTSALLRLANPPANRSPTRTPKTDDVPASDKGRSDADTTADTEPSAGARDIAAPFNAAGKEAKLDLSPLLALTDSWTGSHLLNGYNRPMTQEELDADATKVALKVQDLNDDKAYKDKYLKYLVNQSEQQADLKREGFDNQQDLVKLKAAVTPKKAAKAANPNSWKNANRGSLEFIASNAMNLNPKDKLSIKAGADEYHGVALEAGKQIAARDGVSEEEGYRRAVERLKKRFPKKAPKDD